MFSHEQSLLSVCPVSVEPFFNSATRNSKQSCDSLIGKTHFEVSNRFSSNLYSVFQNITPKSK